MKKTHLLVATALMALAAAPAFADWNNIGSTNISHQQDRHEEMLRFSGPVQTLRLRGDRSPLIVCDAIDATFTNGQSKRIYAGPINQNENKDIDMSSEPRTIRSLRFDCNASGGNGGTIQISADIGRGNNFPGNNNNNFPGNNNNNNNFPGNNNFQGNNNNNNNNFPGNNNGNIRWQNLDSVRFQDTSITFNGGRGGQVDAVGLMPVEADARCSRITVQYQNGRYSDFTVNNGNVMRRGQTYALDLPGNDRNLRAIRLQCQSEGPGGVTIRVLVGR